MKPSSLRGLAARLGVSHTGLAKAIRERRLTAGVEIVDGAIAIADSDACAAQWAQIKQLRPSRAADTDTPGEESDGGARPYEISRARREAALAALAEIELAEKQSELVIAADVEARLVNVFSSCKTKLLGVPSRARQRDPTLTGLQIDLFESLIREALEDLARPAEE